MKHYALQASLPTGNAHRIEATAIEASDDSNAMMEAIGRILDKAMTSELWAKGHISLTSSDGRLVAEMGAK